MSKFPHLKFVKKISGKARAHGGGGTSAQSKENKENRQKHSDILSSETSIKRSNWNKYFENREENNLVSIEKEVVPIFIKIDQNIIDADFNLDAFGIEVISEERDGYIIGASLDNLKSLEEKIKGFVTQKHGTAKIANLWEIYEGNREEWKPQYILSAELFAKWNEIQDDEVYRLEVSVASAKSIGKRPDPNKQGGEKRLNAYYEKSDLRDEELRKRESHFEQFIEHYGEINSGLVDLGDSFGCEVSITGLGLKDLVVNYQFVFEVCEIEEVSSIETGIENSLPDLEIDIVPPNDEAIEIGVIDSGIMEGHRLISAGIKSENSKSYVVADSSTADYVGRGGHGTRVAGAILYPKGLEKVTSPYKLPFFVRNLRILNANNELLHRYPASLMQDIVNENVDCKIFNLSVNAAAPHRKVHMSTWAAIIDKLSYEKDVLFVISAGNIPIGDIRYCLQQGKNYPQYLQENHCRLANPSHSLFALCVGSINHNSFEDEYWKSLGDTGNISPFSRIGTGIWNSIKPDVVEYGGGLIRGKTGFNIKEHETLSPELIRSTFHGGSASGKDVVGTSYAAPKVTHIAAILKQLYLEENSNCLIRALIAQGARLPNEHFLKPSVLSIQHFGYGVPSLERVTKNNEYRTTYYSTGTISAEEGHLYSLKIPKSIRGQGDEFDILIEVTLAFSSQIRRTRRRTKSYLATWLDWSTAKIGESFEEYEKYTLKEVNGKVNFYDSEARKAYDSIEWKVRNNNNYGSIKGLSRSNGSLQKDWTIIKSFQLPEEFGITVRGHKGWDKNHEEIPYALTISMEVLGTDIPIYQSIKIENEVEIET